MKITHDQHMAICKAFSDPEDELFYVFRYLAHALANDGRQRKRYLQVFASELKEALKD